MRSDDQYLVIYNERSSALFAEKSHPVDSRELGMKISGNATSKVTRGGVLFPLDVSILHGVNAEEISKNDGWIFNVL